MQKIVPNIWFDHVAAEAAEFYTAALPDTRVTRTVNYPTEGLLDFQRDLAGQPLTVEFEIGGYRMIGINAGPEFEVNPSISFMLNFDPARDPHARDRLDRTWRALSDGGRELMPLGCHDFSQHYGWVADRYGVSWQLILTDPIGEPRPFVIPTLLFGDGAQGRAAEAIDYYTSLFPGARTGGVVRYPQQVGPATAGSIRFGEVQLFDQWVVVMDAATDQDSTFNCGVSLMLECADQRELDRYWAGLSAVPEAEQCGWCADRFGVSWQVVPANLDELMGKPGAFATLMDMKKIDVAAFG